MSDSIRDRVFRPGESVQFEVGCRVVFARDGGGGKIESVTSITGNMVDGQFTHDDLDNRTGVGDRWQVQLALTGVVAELCAELERERPGGSWALALLLVEVKSEGENGRDND